MESDGRTASVGGTSMPSVFAVLTHQMAKLKKKIPASSFLFAMLSAYRTLVLLLDKRGVLQIPSGPSVSAPITIITPLGPSPPTIACIAHALLMVAMIAVREFLFVAPAGRLLHTSGFVERDDAPHQAGVCMRLGGQIERRILSALIVWAYPLSAAFSSQASP
jgi:hypothetical protein